jgi:hypothetical protein
VGKRIGCHSESKTLPLAYPSLPAENKKTANPRLNHVRCLLLLLMNQVGKFQIKAFLGLIWMKLPKIFGEVAGHE